MTTSNPVWRILMPSEFHDNGLALQRVKKMWLIIFNTMRDHSYAIKWACDLEDPNCISHNQDTRQTASYSVKTQTINACPNLFSIAPMSFISCQRNVPMSWFFSTGMVVNPPCCNAS